MVINHHISNVMVPIGLRAAFHGLIGLESSFEAFPENHGLLSKDMDDKVINNLMNDVLLPKRRYPENFMIISKWEVCQEGGFKKGVLGGHFVFLSRDMDDRFIHNVMNDVLLSCHHE